MSETSERLEPVIESYLPWRAGFAKALDPHFYPIEYVDALICGERARLFCDDKAAILVEVKEYPTGLKDAHGLLAAGDLDAILRLITKAEDWGRANGCSGALIDSREGWARVLKSHGYEPHQVAVRKVL